MGSPFWKSRSTLIACLTGLVISLSFFLLFRKNTGWEWVVAIAILILGTAVSGLIINSFVVGYLNQQKTIKHKSQMFIWGFLCFLAGVWLVLNIPIPFPAQEINPYLPSKVSKFVFFVSSGVGIGLLLFLASLWLAGSLPRSNGAGGTIPKKGAFLKYSIPMALVWGIYLLAFFPGMMSADSMDQWGQMLTGQYINHHPVFHTLLIWLLTRIYLSPVVVAIAQIIAMALVAGAWLGFFETLGINRWIIWITAFVFAVIPVNGTMVNTLWKDIPYGIAVMGLTLILARIVFSRGEWAAARSAKISLGITLAFVALLRHDGLVLATGAVFFVVIMYPVKWRYWIFSTIIFAFLYFGIRGPLYNWLRVRQSTTLADSFLSLFDLAAYSTPGSEADEYLSSLHIYPPNWNCGVWSNLDPDWRSTSIDESQSIIQITRNLINNIPLILVYDYRCERSIEWIIWDPYGEVRNASHVEVLVDPNPYGIQHASLLPAFRDWIANWVIKTSHDPSVNWFLWRPALFLYFNLSITAILILRNRDLRFALISIPILLQAITFTLLFALPNFRYYYATYLVAVITIPLLFSPPSDYGITVTPRTSKQ